MCLLLYWLLEREAGAGLTSLKFMAHPPFPFKGAEKVAKMEEPSCRLIVEVVEEVIWEVTSSLIRFLIFAWIGRGI